MELFDIVDEQGHPTGEIVERSVAHANGICHRTAHIWIIKGDQVLLQKRSLNKDSYPGEYDTSSAGHVMAGDEVIDSALRELEEELGIKATKDNLQYIGQFRIQYEEEFHGSMFKDNEVVFLYIYNKPVTIEDLSLQPEEIESVAWFDFKDVMRVVEDGTRDIDGCRICVPSGGLKLIEQFIQTVN
ncbi:MAG: NUDIX domain-containing protein [Erysipelotrichaceae bacterium]|nr:NUDIX domain-containing protein [Erysipelotrichaceae bacterium]